MLRGRLKSEQDFREEPLIGENDLKAIERVSKRYAVGFTAHVMKTIRGFLKHDPVAKQYIPQMDELKILPEEDTDPIGDHKHSPVKGIVHRYPDRVLFMPANVCAVYCRYCFRREKVGPGSEILSPEERAQALDYIRSNKNIWEVILSGGDPLVLSPRQLKSILEELNSIKHVQTVRFHTRVPIADPARITNELLETLKTSEKPINMVLHINHKQELSEENTEALARLRAASISLLSQSVLLKGINDKAETLETLFRALITYHIKPYYLHHPDLAPGTSHFRVTLDEGRRIMKDLRGRVSGICLPEYVLDIPGGYGKVPVQSSYAKEIEDSLYELEDYQGGKHLYPPKQRETAK